MMFGARRLILFAACAGSIATLSIVLLIRSRFIADTLQVPLGSYEIFIASSFGQLSFIVRDPETSPQLDLKARRVPNSQRRLYWTGFLQMDPGIVGVGVPLWCVWLCFAGMTVASLYRIRIHRAHDQVCQNCGYDIRASHERCPECGHKMGDRGTGTHRDYDK
jgi:hypothetical protein